MARQHGNSRLGPDDLDRAERNQGRSGPRDDRHSSNRMSAGAASVEPEGFAADLETGDTGQLLADGEVVGRWSERDDDAGEDAEDRLLAEDEVVGDWSVEASDEGSDDDMDDRSMRAHGSDRAAADGQHGLSGGRQEPGSGPRHR
jgi:hypothetical protein